MSTEARSPTRRNILPLPLAGLAASAVAGAAVASGPQGEAAQAGGSQVVDGVLAYLGVLPAAIVRGHPASHPEGAMHGGPTEGRHAFHLVLALFDAASGARIEEAEVGVNIMGVGHIPADTIALDPMKIAGTVTWGAFVELPGRDQYRLDFSVATMTPKRSLTFHFVFDDSSN